MKIIGNVLKANGNTFWSVTPDAPVNNAIKLMSENEVKALPVLEEEKLVGVVSENDCIRKVILMGKSTKKTQVREIMSSNMHMASPDQSVEECLAQMTDEHVRHLPVIANGSLVGFVSMSDLLQTIIDDQKDYIYGLENYILGTDYGR